MHELWEIHEWQSATEEQVIAALFNAPQFIDPHDIGEIRRYHSTAIRKYQVLFYKGEIPSYAVNPLKKRKR